MALIERVRLALRIKANAFDEEIDTLIKACMSDMRLSGVQRLREEDPMFAAACVQYCKANFGQDTEVGTRERWEKCYRALRDSMALSREYGSLGKGAAAGEGKEAAPPSPDEKEEVAPVQPEGTEGAEDVVQG